MRRGGHVPRAAAMPWCPILACGELPPQYGAGLLEFRHHSSESLRRVGVAHILVHCG